LTTKYSFRFGFTPDVDGFSCMELDRILAAGEDLDAPIVRFYTWKKPTISFGLNQNPGKRLKIERCLSDGIEMVARPTGGREILHGWDLCCSVIWPVDKNRSALEFSRLFVRINGILSEGLRNMGIDAKTHSVSIKAVVADGPCFSQIDRGEISVEGKKIVASAQRIFARAVLQQSSISISKPGVDLMDYMLAGQKSNRKGSIVNSAAYAEEVLEETFPIPRIVENFETVFRSELGESVFFEFRKVRDF
jgi:lipoate-protein ligase A